jgi:SOS-response transcriptional repressor LexA
VIQCCFHQAIFNFLGVISLSKHHRFVSRYRRFSEHKNAQYLAFAMRKLKKTNNIGQRLRALRKKLGITQANIAKRMFFSRNYISWVENGRVPSPRFVRAMELIEQAPMPTFEHSSVVQEEPFALDSHGGETEGAVTAHVIPLLSWAQAGTARAWEDLKEHEGFVGFNLLDPKAVAVRIRGDNMEPHFPHDTIAIVYPGWKAKSGDLVIARLKDGTVLFKRFHVDGNHCTFISLNSIYPPQTVEKSKVEMVLPVGGTYQSHL